MPSHRSKESELKRDHAMITGSEQTPMMNMLAEEIIGEMVSDAIGQFNCVLY
jgi:hypothetical protein